MHNQVFYLKTCSTNKKILDRFKPYLKHFELQEIKSSPITAQQLDELQKRIGSYEALFSKKSTLYKTRQLKNVALSEKDMRALILEHYSFLKRPVFVYKDNVYAGYAESTLQALETALSTSWFQLKDRI